jgi:hypothetical protein
LRSLRSLALFRRANDLLLLCPLAPTSPSWRRFLPSSEFHDFHHLKFNVNYGVLGFLDWFHCTDGMFYEDK